MVLDPKHLDLLARDGSAVGRGRLLTDLSRLVLIERQAETTELDIFFDIVRSILGSAAERDRLGFAETAADHGAVPHDVILVLANDEARIAEPVLTRSVLLDEGDLAEIVNNRTDEHMRAIAARAQVSDQLSSLLVDRGSRAVVLRLTSNPGATLSDETFHQLQTRAERDPDLLRLLTDRSDLADLLARNMRETLSHLAERAHRPNASGPRPPRLAHPRAGAPGTAPVAEAPVAKKKAPEATDVLGLVERVHRGEIGIGAVVTDLAGADRHADLACFLGTVAGIDESQIMRVLVRSDSLGIAMVARGLDVDEEAYGRIVDLRKRRLKFGATQAKHERDHYASVDPAEARATIFAHGARRGRG